MINKLYFTINGMEYFAINLTFVCRKTPTAILRISIESQK